MLLAIAGFVAILSDEIAIAIGIIVGGGALLGFAIEKRLLPRPVAAVCALVIICAMGLLVYSSASAASLVPYKGGASAREISADMWEDGTERWVQLVALTTTGEQMMGGFPALYLYSDGVKDRWLSESPIAGHPVRGTHVNVQGVFDDIVSVAFGSGEESGEYTYFGSGSAGCAISCNEIRRESPNCADAAALEWGRLMERLAVGLALTGIGVAGGVVWHQSVATSSLMAGGITLEALAGFTAALALLGLGTIAYVWLLFKAESACLAYAADEMNGCPGCGFVEGTEGWVYTGLGTDMCVNPACGVVLDGTAGHKDDGDDRGDDDDGDGDDRFAPPEDPGLDVPDREHYGGSDFDGGGIALGDGCYSATGNACVRAGCGPTVIACDICDDSTICYETP